MAGVALPIFKNVNYNLHAHGSNLGSFFELPRNTRIFIPSLNETLYATIDAECVFAQLNLLTIDPACSNINALLKEFLDAQSAEIGKPLNYKIYDSTLGITTCPNIYYEREKSVFNSGVAKCPVTIKQTYLQDYITNSKERKEEFRQRGDTIDIDNPNEMIIEFKAECKAKGILYPSELLSLDPRNSLRKRIIAHLLFPYTKKIDSRDRTPDLIELPNYVTFYDSTNFTTIDHLKYKIFGQRDLGKNSLFLEDIIRYYRRIIDDDPSYGRETIITFLTFACNKIEDPAVKSSYDRGDQGILYEEFSEKISKHSLDPEAREDFDIQQTIVPRLNLLYVKKSGFIHSDNDKKKLGFRLLRESGISIRYDKIHLLNKLREAGLNPNAYKLMIDCIKGVYGHSGGSSIENKYYLKYLKYKNKYLKITKIIN
jgi:hypothetical protein